MAWYYGALIGGAVVWVLMVFVPMIPGLEIRWYWALNGRSGSVQIGVAWDMGRMNGKLCGYITLNLLVIDIAFEIRPGRRSG